MLLSSVCLAMLIFVLCYQEGGQGPKWTRRFVGPIFLGLVVSAIGLIAHNTNPLYYAGGWGFLVAANGFSYGGKYTHNKTGLKILFRGLCGLSYGLCSLMLGLSTGHVVYGVGQIGVSILASVIFGVFGPFPNAWGDWKTRTEDVCISSFYMLFLIKLLG